MKKFNTMKRLILFFTVIFTCSVCLVAQVSNTSAVISDTVIFTDLTTENIYIPPVCYSFAEKGVYYFHHDNQKKGSLKFFYIDYETAKIKEINVLLNKKDILNDLSLYPIDDFWFDKNNLFISDYDGIKKFKQTDSGNYVLEEIIKVPGFHGSFNVENFNDSIKLFWGAGDKGGINSVVYNIYQKKILAQRKFSILQTLTYFSPRKIICTDEERVFFTPSSEYSIYIYDTNLELIDSVIYDKPDWHPLTAEKEKQILSVTKEPIDLIYDYSDELSGPSSIRKITVLGDYLFVLHNEKKNGSLNPRYDLWYKDDSGKWILKYENVDDNADNGKSEDKLRPFRKFAFKNGYLYALEHRVPVFRKDFAEEKKYIKAYNKHLIDKGGVLTIQKLHFK